MLAGGGRIAAAALGLFVCIWAVGGCAGGNAPLSDPIGVLRDPDENSRLRSRAAGQIWDQVEAGQVDPAGARVALKSVTWANANPGNLRLAAFEAILRDRRPEALSDTQQMVGLMLMRERDPEMVERLSRAAVDEGWRDVTPYLVRSLARPLELAEFEERPELLAIRSLNPDLSLAEVTFRVFLDPGVDPGPYSVRYDLRARADAWEILARIDPDQSLRRQLLVSASADRAATDVEVLRGMRRGLLDLGVVASTGDEMRWLLRLREQGDQLNAEWWRRSARAVRGLEDDRGAGLELRHIEAIRWAAANRSDWLVARRAELLAELAERLADRRVIRRSENDFSAGKQPREDLASNADDLRWADLITFLVIDESVQTPRVVRELFRFADLDRADRTTEYGGLIEATELGPEPFQAVVYPPRARARSGDDRFVASDDLIEASDRALAHFHLQVQQPNNRRFAGPSLGDIIYAARSGRTALVFTSIDEDTLNVDAYQPDGLVLDLGLLRRPLD
ncbi:MAG: hypothetical protein AAGB51_11390 [Planctomycetota bacterium]